MTTATYDEVEGGFGGDTDLVRLIAGRGMMRKNRLRKLLLAKLLQDRSEEGSDSGDYDYEDDEAGGEHRFAKLLIGGAVRRRRLRRMLLSHLIHERMSDDEAAEDDDSSDDERQLVRFLIGARAIRRRRLRRAAVAKAWRGRGEEDESQEFDEEGGMDDHRLAKLLIGGTVRRRRLRRLLLAHLIGERSGEVEPEDIGIEEDEEGETGLGPVGRAAVARRATRGQRVSKAALARALADQDA